MTWASPDWLKVVPAIGAGLVILVAMKVVRWRHAAVRWPSIQRVVAAGSRLLPVHAGRSFRRPWLLLLACASIALALARPQWGEIERPVFERAREVVLALDLSRSMLVGDVPPDRLTRAKLLLRSLLDQLRGERIGLVVFAGSSFVQVPLSGDYQILHEFLPELSPGYMPQGGTDYAGMLRAASGSFSDTAETDRFLIVLSDGEALDEGWRSQLSELVRRNVRVIALGIGTATGGFIPDPQSGFLKDERGAVVLSRLEPTTLRSLAQETRGAYRDASQWVDLAALLQETIAQGRRGEFREEQAVERIERFQWFLAAGVLLAALGMWREIGVRPRSRSVGAERTTGRHASRPRRGARSASARVMKTTVVLIVSILTLSGPDTAAAEQAADEPSPAQAVRETVARLADGTQHRATDWLELAERTLSYGRDRRATGEPVQPGPVLDALAAADAGEALDADAADWGRLRAELLNLLEEPPQSEQQKKDDDNAREEPHGEQEQKAPDSQQSDRQPGEEDAPPEQSQGAQQSGTPGDPQGEEQKPPSVPDESNKEQQPSPAQSPAGDAPDEGRMGELDAPDTEDAEPPPTEAAPEQATRKIGGRPVDEMAPPPTSPEMAAALQRLREAVRGDSPARLFQLLEKDAAAPSMGGKDW